MKINSEQDARYSFKWMMGCLEIFHDGEFIGKAEIPTLREAMKVFEVVVQGKAPLQDIIRFNEATKGMIGADLSAMSYSKDRQQILHKGIFFSDA